MHGGKDGFDRADTEGDIDSEDEDVELNVVAIGDTSAKPVAMVVETANAHIARIAVDHPWRAEDHA